MLYARCSHSQGSLTRRGNTLAQVIRQRDVAGTRFRPAGVRFPHTRKGTWGRSHGWGHAIRGATAGQGCSLRARARPASGAAAIRGELARCVQVDHPVIVVAWLFPAVRSRGEASQSARLNLESSQYSQTAPRSEVRRSHFPDARGTELFQIAGPCPEPQSAAWAQPSMPPPAQQPGRTALAAMASAPGSNRPESP